MPANDFSSLIENNDVDGLKKFLENTSNSDLKFLFGYMRYNANRTALILACCSSSQKSLATPIVQVLIAKILDVGSEELLKKQLELKDENENDCLMAVFRYSSSVETIYLILDRIRQVGGTALLKKHLTATNKSKDNCLVLASYNSSCPDAASLKLVIDALLEVGGLDGNDNNSLLKEQLSATYGNGQPCLMSACEYSSKEGIELLIEKIVELRGKDVLRKELSEAKDFNEQTCAMMASQRSNVEIIKLVMNKIVEVCNGGDGDPAALRKQLEMQNRDGMTCFLITCSRNREAIETTKYILDKIAEVGGRDMVINQLCRVDRRGVNCLYLVCSWSCSIEVVKFLIRRILEAGGEKLLFDILKQEKSSKDHYQISGVLLEAVAPRYDDVLSQEEAVILNFTASLLFHFDLLAKQHAKLDDDYAKWRLKNRGHIDASWTPDAENIAQVKKILETPLSGGDEKSANNNKTTAAHQSEDDHNKKLLVAEKGAAKKKFEEQHQASTTQSKAQEAASAVVAQASKATTEHEHQQPLTTQNKQKQNADDVVSVDSVPPSRCFKRGVPDKNLEAAVRALFSIKEAPEKRPDLKNWIPDGDDASDLLHYLNHSLPELKARSSIQKLIAECKLTDDDIKILHSYKVQNPYPVYLWLNGWLGGDRRDDFVKEHVAPFFILLYRAMEKLPRVKTVADRAIKVNNIPALQNTFNNFKVACAPNRTLSFWGFSSFSTEDGVINREEFVGKPSEEAIVYSCGELEGVDMEPFAPKGLKSESEILPLCPCVLEVVNHVKMGQKLIVGVKQLNHADFSYVAPK